jgi:hypothetical protein
MPALAPRICLILLTPIWYFICHYSRPESRATMYPMKRLLESGPVCWLLFLALGLSLSLTQSCARSEPQTSGAGSSAAGSSGEGSAVGEQKLPFHPTTDQASAEGAHPAVSPDSKLKVKMSSALPFASHAHILPAGTLLTVQLENSLSTAKVREGDTFTASIAAPLTIDGDSMVERGAVTTGRVESVRSQAGSGYFRLTLSAIAVEGRQLALQTSSLFARGTSQPPDEVRVQKGRRLTFRLTSPLTLNEPKAMASQSLGPATE